MAGRESTSKAHKKTRNRKNQANIIIASLAIVVFVFTSSFFSTLQDLRFYEMQFVKNDIDIPARMQLAQEVIDNIDHGTPLGNSFSERDRLHMSDVQDLIGHLKILHYITALVLLIELVIIFQMQSLYRTFMYAGISIIALTLLSLVLAVNFQYFFLKFHLVFFNNDLWMMDPAQDMLIRLFPQAFFESFVLNVYKLSLISALVLLMGSYFMNKALDS